jgi:hypothetical protein
LDAGHFIDQADPNVRVYYTSSPVEHR